MIRLAANLNVVTCQTYDSSDKGYANLPSGMFDVLLGLVQYIEKENLSIL